LQLHESASEVRALVGAIQGGGVAPLLDALLWRALAFFGACFALLLLYRAMARRIGAKRGSLSA